jgi:hypothetical protein
MVIGRIDQFVDEPAARGRIAALHLDINFCDARLKGKPLTISELAEHYRQRELKPDTVWKTHSTKLTYEKTSDARKLLKRFGVPDGI